MDNSDSNSEAGSVMCISYAPVEPSLKVPQPHASVGQDEEQCDNQDIEGILTLLNDLMESLKNDSDMNMLDEAIRCMREALRRSSSEELKSKIENLLLTTLLIRVTLCKSVEDIELCHSLLRGDNFSTSIRNHLAAVQNMNESTEGIRLAAQSIQKYREAIPIDTLNTIICVAEEAMSSYHDTNGVSSSLLLFANILLLSGDALLMRYFSKGDALDLEQAERKFRHAEGLCTNDIPLTYVSVVSLTNIGCLRFVESGETEMLAQSCDRMKQVVVIEESGRNLQEMAIRGVNAAGDKMQLQQAMTAALACASHYAPPHPKSPIVLGKLGATLAAYYESKGSGDLQILNDCIRLFNDALKLCRPSYPNYSELLLNLGACLLQRHMGQDSAQDLSEAIVLFQKALLVPTITTFNRSMTINNLAAALHSRFRQQGAMDDLEQCIAYHEQALILRPTPHPERPLSLQNLANALSNRFKETGKFQDLEQCIALYKEALVLLPQLHPMRPSLLSNLGGAFSILFHHKGNIRDLDTSVRLHEESLRSQPLPHTNPGHWHSMNNLANALLARFSQKGVHQNLPQDLHGSIMLRRRVLELLPSTHWYRGQVLTSLASSLSLRAELTGRTADFEEGIVVHKQALSLQPPLHPNYQQFVHDLALTLSRKFLRMRQVEDLDESISLFTESLSLQPTSHPQRVVTLYNLADSFHQRFEYQKNDEDIEKSLFYYESASRAEAGQLLLRFRSSRVWAFLAQTHRPSTALNAYRYALELLPLLASLDRTLQERQEALKNGRELACDAARCALDMDESEVAVTFLSTGRSTFWSQILHLRTPVEELALNNPDLAKKFLAINERLEQGSHDAAAYLQFSAPSQQPYHSKTYVGLSALVEERQQTIQEIRQTPGSEEFLQPPSFASLQRAAVHGPVIMLNATKRGCDAIIMEDTKPVRHVPLLALSAEVMDHLKELTDHVLSSQGLRSVDSEPVRGRLGKLLALLPRDMVQESALDSDESTFRSVLGILWVTLVKPIVETLELQRTDMPKRIWWCPSGVFTSFPIHAAGQYSGNNEPQDCLFQYAISSYCTSPQDLTHLPPHVPRDFRMAAIIEPEAPGAAPLVAVNDELDKITVHVPDATHLTVRLGLRVAPNAVDDVLHDISHSSIVHFGCHGFQNPNDPLESCLLLSGGTLTMARIIKECQTSSAALAYLSACQTATGDKDRPDEFLSLTATMMFAGFRSVVGTLWSIMDDDAPIVADAFYGHLFRNGKNSPLDVRDAAYALHLATKKLRDMGAPFSRWVPYVHYGI